MNPILSREIRSRFRDKRSFWLLMGLSTLLCLAAWWIYRDALERMHWSRLTDYSNPYGYSIESASQTGRDLFRTLAYGNVLMWMLVAPALTATGLCKERERGLLESLWLTPFRVSSQIWGRFAASLLFLFELQLITLPIYGIAFMLGGVAPQEILRAGAVITTTAIAGTALGLWCSARSYRPAGSIGSALGFVIGSSLYAVLAPPLFSSMFFVRSWNIPIRVLIYSSVAHPIQLLELAIESDGSSFRFLGSIPDSFLTYSLVIQLSVSLLWLLLATRKAAKPLAESASMHSHPFLEGYRNRLAKRQAAQKERNEKARVSQKVGGALIYEVPFEKLVHFRDPLIKREVTARFRLRQSSLVITLLRLGILLLVLGTWLFMILTLIDSSTRGALGTGLIFLLTVLGILAVGVQSSSALIGEREKGTWEGLNLSLLSTRHIVRSKWISPLITFGFWSSAMWVWLPFCAHFGNHLGIRPFMLLGAISIAVVTFAATSAWGLYVSSRSPHTAAAACWTLATLLVFFVGAPFLDDMLSIKPRIVNIVFGAGTHTTPFTTSGWNTNGYSNDDRNRDLFSDLLDSYHPLIALGNVIDDYQRYQSYGAYEGSDLSTEQMALKFGTWLLSLSGGIAVTALLLNLTEGRLKKIET